MTAIESALEHFSAEVDSASYSYCVAKAVNIAAAGDPSLMLALNRNPLTWRVLLHSLQTTTFIALGRMFDTDSDSLSAMTLLRLASTQVDVFSKEGLRVRKMAGGFSEPVALDAYLKNAYQPSAADFDDLLPVAQEWADVFSAKNKPIRNKLLAHRDLKHLDKVVNRPGFSGDSLP